MRKKIFSLSANTSLGTTFLWPLTLVLGLTIVSLGSEQVWGNSREIPGLPIARLALPSIRVNPNVGTPTGTLVGEKVIELKKRIQNIETFANSIIHSIREQYEQAIIEVNQYHYVVSEIEAKLQLGTTPSNPKLIDMQNIAMQQLQEIADTISMMDELAAGFSESSEQVRLLALQIDNTFHMPGAIDEDHAHLILMSEELSTVNEAIVQSHEILNANRLRQSEWLNAERLHLANLSSAIDKGKITFNSQTETIKPPLQAILAEQKFPLKKKVRKTHPQRKTDKVQLPINESSEKLSSEIFAPIHQEILKEIALTSSKDTTPPSPSTETYSYNNQENTFESVPITSEPITEVCKHTHQEHIAPIPAPFEAVLEVHDKNHQNITHKVSTPSPVPLMLVAEARKKIRSKKVSNEALAPASIPPEPASEAHNSIHQQASHKVQVPTSIPLEPAPQKHRAVNKEVPQELNEAKPQQSVITPTDPQATREETLPLISVAAHSKVHPLSDEGTVLQHSQQQANVSETPISFSTAAKDRLPLVHLDPNKEIRNQKWVLVSSAKRGLKNPSAVLDIVNVVGEKGSSNRGEEVKSLLIETGLKPQQLRVINVKAEENQAEQVYIFIGN